MEGNIFPVLAWAHRVIAPDMLNYGKSDKPRHADVSIVAQARLMVGVRDALGIARADGVSHDIGGGVAQIIAVRRPERVKKRVLSSAVCFDSWPIPEFIARQAPGAEAEMSLSDFLGMLRGFLPQVSFVGAHLPRRRSDTDGVVVAPVRTTARAVRQRTVSNAGQ